jgi:hypothetical protein
MNKIYIPEQGYLKIKDALIVMTREWVDGGNYSRETVLTMKGVIEYLIEQFSGYPERDKIWSRACFDVLSLDEAMEVLERFKEIRKRE